MFYSEEQYFHICVLLRLPVFYVKDGSGDRSGERDGRPYGSILQVKHLRATTRVRVEKVEEKGQLSSG